MQIQRHHFAGLPDKQSLLSWGSLFGVTILLVGMVSFWSALILWGLLGWSIHQERSGISSPLWNGIPKRSVEIQIVWSDRLDRIELTLPNHEHTWIKGALTQWFITAIGLLCIGLGIIPAALVCTLVLPILFLRPSSITHTPHTEINDTQKDDLQIIADRTCSWDVIHQSLVLNQVVLPNTGTFIIAKDDTRQPFVPPSTFSNWTLLEVSPESK